MHGGSICQSRRLDRRTPNRQAAFLGCAAHEVGATDMNAEVPEQQIRALSDGATLSIIDREQVFSRVVWFRQTENGLEAAPAPAEDWRGAEHWWLPGASRKEGMASALPDIMGWLPPGVLAPRKFQAAADLAYFDKYGSNNSVVDAVFLDDAMHLHFVDVREQTDECSSAALFSQWESSLSMRRRRLRESLFTSEAAPVLRLRGEYGKLCAAKNKPTFDAVASVLDTYGDFNENVTEDAFWRQVGKRCTTYWDSDLRCEEQGHPFHTLVVDGEAPAQADLPEEKGCQTLGRKLVGNLCLACITPFQLEGQGWLRLQSRAWLRTPNLGMWTETVRAESLALTEGRTAAICGMTDVGRQREANQDAFSFDDQAAWAVVADGMGGHPQGDAASAEAVQAFRQHMGRLPESHALLPFRGVAQHLLQAARQAHAKIWERNKDKNSIVDSMGATLSALCLHGDRASIVHAGDSRIYRYRPGGLHSDSELQQITTDHGEGSGLDRALGLWERIAFDIDVVAAPSDCLFLLCSDGLTDMLEHHDIFRILNEHARQGLAPTRLAQELVDAANEAGGRDNITVCIVAVKDEAPQ